MTDFAGNGGGNPFSQGGGASVAQPPAKNNDPQSDASNQAAMVQNNLGGGDTLTPQAPEQMSSQGFLVACLDCGQEGTRKSVTASLVCRCGSRNLVFDENPDAVASVPRAEWSQTDLVKHFTSGLTGYVRPEFQGTEETNKWHWSLSKDGSVVSHGYADSRDEAQEVIDTIEPNFARRLASRTAAFPPPKKKDDSKDDSDKSKDDSDKGTPAPPGGSPTGTPPAGGNSAPATPPPVGQPVPPAQQGAPAAPAAPGAPAAPQAPVQAPAAPADPNAAGPAAGDTDGNSAPPPADDSGEQAGGEAPLGADPQNPTKEAPSNPKPGDDPTSEVPAPDPNDPAQQAGAVPPVPGQDPNAAGVQPAEMNTPMDMAQNTLDAVVEQAKQLGHDAMESAYDVDQLFSEWRCNNCGQEGRADISDDGQVQFSGDLLDGPQGCPNPVVAPGQDPNAVAPVDPNAAAAAAPPPGGDAAGPVVPQPAVQASRRFLRRRAASETEQDINRNRPNLSEGGHNEPDEKQAPSSGSVSPDPGGELEEKVSQLIEDIQTTNPGMNEHTARKVAQETLRRFPTVLGGIFGPSAPKGWTLSKGDTYDHYQQDRQGTGRDSRPTRCGDR